MKKKIEMCLFKIDENSEETKPKIYSNLIFTFYHLDEIKFVIYLIY